MFLLLLFVLLIRPLRRGGATGELFCDPKNFGLISAAHGLTEIQEQSLFRGCRLNQVLHESRVIGHSVVGFRSHVPNSSQNSKAVFPAFSVTERRDDNSRTGMSALGRLCCHAECS